MASWLVRSSPVRASRVRALDIVLCSWVGHFALTVPLSTQVYKGLFTWRKGARGGLTSHTFLSKTHRSVYMLDRVARLPGAPCLLVRGTWLGGVAFCHVNGSSRAISANRGEINRKNMAARSKYFLSCHLPVLSTEQNDSHLKRSML